MVSRDLRLEHSFNEVVNARSFRWIILRNLSTHISNQIAQFIMIFRSPVIIAVRVIARLETVSKLISLLEPSRIRLLTVCASYG